MMKKLLFALMTASVLFWGTSCGSDDDSSTPQPSYSSTITVTGSAENNMGSVYLSQSGTFDVTVTLQNTEFSEAALAYNANQDVTSNVVLQVGSAPITTSQVVLKEKISTDAKNVATFTITFAANNLTEAKSGTTTFKLTTKAPLIAAAQDITSAEKSEIAYSFLGADVAVSGAVSGDIGDDATGTITVTLANNTAFADTVKALTTNADLTNYFTIDAVDGVTVNSITLKEKSETSLTANITVTATKAVNKQNVTVTAKKELIKGAEEDTTGTLSYEFAASATVTTEETLVAVAGAVAQNTFVVTLKGDTFKKEVLEATANDDKSGLSRMYVTKYFTFAFSNSSIEVLYAQLTEAVTTTNADATQVKLLVDYKCKATTAGEGTTTVSVTVSKAAVTSGAVPKANLSSPVAYNFGEHKVDNTDGTSTLVIQESTTTGTYGYQSPTGAQQVNTTDTKFPGYTNGYLEYLTDLDVVYSVYAPSAIPDAKLRIRYALWGSAVRGATVKVNDTVAGTVYMPVTSAAKPQDEIVDGRWTYTAELTGVSLKEGNNAITLAGATSVTVDGEEKEADGNLPNIDYLEITGKGITYGTGNFYTLAYASENTEYGTVSGTVSAGTVAADTPVTLTATPKAGYEFDCWYGTGAANTSSLALTVTKNVNVTAHFVPTGTTVPQGLVGYATVAGDNGTTYKITGAHIVSNPQKITLSSLSDLETNKTKLSSDTPYIVKIAGTITTADNKSVDYTLGPNKTMYSADGSGRFKNVEIKIHGVNIIVRNVKFGEVIGDDFFGGTGNDALSIHASKFVWIDHCEFQSHLTPVDNVSGQNMTHQPGVNTNESSETEWKKDFYDGLLDIKDGSAWVTISNSYFHDHYKACLCGSSDVKENGDTAMRVTFANNYWKDINARQPLFRYGKAHIYNSYFVTEATAVSGSTGINCRAGSELYIDQNYFKNIKTPIGYYNDVSASHTGTWTTVGNEFDSCQNAVETSSTSYVPPYSWDTLTVSEIPTTIPATAGATLTSLTY